MADLEQLLKDILLERRRLCLDEVASIEKKLGIQSKVSRLQDENRELKEKLNLQSKTSMV